jgi:prefoldin subunit 5
VASIRGGAPYPTPPTAEQELRTLKAQADYYAEVLEEVKRRIAKLEQEVGQENA